MRRSKASICYEIITHESAEEGDFAEHGWLDSGGTEWPLRDDEGDHPDILERARAGEFDQSVGEAIAHAIQLGATSEVSVNGDCLSARSVDAPLDWENITCGESRYYSLHIEGCTEGTLARIARVLKRSDP